MKILVTGGNGQLGLCLQRASEASWNEYVFVGSGELDVSDVRGVDEMVGNGEWDVVVNCAAYTNVDKAETEQWRAREVNGVGVGNLAEACKRCGAVLVHVSTDYVFGGIGETALRENDVTGPLNVYGLTKLEGERAALASGCRCVIVRTAWLYSDYGQNFVRKMVELSGTRDGLTVVNDQWGSPTFAQDLADDLVKIIDGGEIMGREGLYHYANAGRVTWWELADAAVSLAGHGKCEVRPCRSDEYVTVAERPRMTALDCGLFERTFGVKMRDWRESLEKCVSLLTEAGA